MKLFEKIKTMGVYDLAKFLLIEYKPYGFVTLDGKIVVIKDLAVDINVKILESEEE